MEEINPYIPYLATIEWAVANTDNDYIRAELISTLRLMYPEASAFEILAAQETAGSDPIFLRTFTKRQIDQRGLGGAKFAVSSSFGLSKTVVQKIFNDDNFEKFLQKKSLKEIQEEVKREEEQKRYKEIKAKEELERKKLLEQQIISNKEGYLAQPVFNIDLEFEEEGLLIFYDYIDEVRKIHHRPEYKIELYMYFEDDGTLSKIEWGRYETVIVPDSIISELKRSITLSQIPQVEINAKKYNVRSKKIAVIDYSLEKSPEEFHYRFKVDKEGQVEVIRKYKVYSTYTTSSITEYDIEPDEIEILENKYHGLEKGKYITIADLRNVIASLNNDKTALTSIRFLTLEN